MTIVELCQFHQDLLLAVLGDPDLHGETFSNVLAAVREFGRMVCEASDLLLPGEVGPAS
jgi:hypothetical protein